MDTADKEVAAVDLRKSIGSRILVRDVMTGDVVCITKYENVNNAVRSLSENNISGIPVVDKRHRVVGIITEADILSMLGVRRGHTFRDILRHILGEHLPERKMGDLVGDVMTSPAVTIKSGAAISEAARIMEERRIKRLPVVDDDNRLVGIISRADIVRAVCKHIF